MITKLQGKLANSHSFWASCWETTWARSSLSKEGTSTVGSMIKDVLDLFHQRYTQSNATSLSLLTRYIILSLQRMRVEAVEAALTKKRRLLLGVHWLSSRQFHWKSSKVATEALLLQQELLLSFATSLAPSHPVSHLPLARVCQPTWPNIIYSQIPTWRKVNIMSTCVNNVLRRFILSTFWPISVNIWNPVEKVFWHLFSYLNLKICRDLWISLAEKSFSFKLVTLKLATNKAINGIFDQSRILKKKVK